MAESVTIPTQDTTPTLEQEAAALEAAGKEAPEPKLAGEEATPERPEWLPEKFKSVEDMAKAYSDLEKKLGTGEKPEAAAATEEAAKEATEAAGLDMDALSAEYSEKGELTAESLSKLEKVGITKDMVEAYIAGQEAQANVVRQQLLEPVGGEEAYGEMIQWASNNLPEKDIDAYNAILEGGDMNAIKMAVENLKSKYTSNVGSEPSRQLSGKGTNGSASAYESVADLMKDMGNREYETNPAFRKKVEAKLARSNIL